MEKSRDNMQLGNNERYYRTKFGAFYVAKFLPKSLLEKANYSTQHNKRPLFLNQMKQVPEQIQLRHPEYR